MTVTTYPASASKTAFVRPMTPALFLHQYFVWLGLKRAIALPYDNDVRF